jgi:hypothetical protein
MVPTCRRSATLLHQVAEVKEAPPWLAAEDPLVVLLLGPEQSRSTGYVDAASPWSLWVEERRRTYTGLIEVFRRSVRERAFVDEKPDYLANLFSVMDQSHA